MSKVTYVNFKGEETVIDLEDGRSLMEGAVYNGIDGIVAECGGSCACATCHVYVDQQFIDLLPTMEEYESEMLEETSSVRQANSRLGCQIRMNSELDGIIVTMPENQ